MSLLFFLVPQWFCCSSFPWKRSALALGVSPLGCQRLRFHTFTYTPAFDFAGHGKARGAVIDGIEPRWVQAEVEARRKIGNFAATLWNSASAASLFTGTCGRAPGAR